MYIRILLMLAAFAVSLEGVSQPHADRMAAIEGPSSLEAGKSLYQQGRYDEALTMLKEAVREEKKSAPAHYWLGMTWFALEDHDEALKALRRAVQLDRKWAPGHVGMGMVYMSLPNRRLDARKAFRRAVKADPENADLQYRMGLTYMDQEQSGRIIGSDRDGRRFFQMAVAMDPTHQDAHFQLGRCFDSPSELDPEKAISAYLDQYRVNPDHNEALLRFANASHRSERYDLGARELREIVLEWGEETPDRIRTLLSQFEGTGAGVRPAVRSTSDCTADLYLTA